MSIMSIALFTSMIEEYRPKHVELWTWLAKNPEKSKSDWPRYPEVRNMRSSCWACEIALCAAREFGITSTKSVEYRCYFCPIAKFRRAQSDSGYCMRANSVFHEWSMALGNKRRSECAQIIADARWLTPEEFICENKNLEMQERFK